MAPFKLISGEFINQPQDVSNQEIAPMQQKQNIDINQGSNLLSEAKRIGAGALGSAAQGLTAIPELAGKALSGLGAAAGLGNLTNVAGNPEQYLGYNKSAEDVYNAPEFKQTLEQNRDKGPKQLIGQALGYENLEPQSFPERFLQGVASDLPNILMGPGGLLNKLITSGASNLGSKTAEHLGLGPIAQLVAGMGTGSASKYLTGRAAGGLRGAAKKIEDGLYKKYDSYAAKAQEPIKPYKKIIDESEKSIQKEIISLRKPLQESINDFGEKLGKKDTTQLKEITDIRQLIGDSIGDAKTPKEKSFYKNLYKQFSTELERSAADHPAIEDYFKANSIDLGLNGSGALRRLASEDNSIKNILKNPVVAALFGSGGSSALGGLLLGKLSPIGAAGTIAASAALPIASQKIARVVNFASQPETRKLIYETLNDALLGDKTSVVNNLKALNNLAKDQKIEEEVKAEKTNNKKKYARYL